MKDVRTFRVLYRMHTYMGSGGGTTRQQPGAVLVAAARSLSAVHLPRAHM
jgi:hypothetical protein